MVSEKQHKGHWLRIGTLTLTTFAPVLASVGSRLFRSRKDERDAAVPPEPEASAVSQEKLQALGAALVDALSDLRTRARPYSEEWLRRGEQLVEVARERGSEFSHLLSERGDQFAHIGHNLAKRSHSAARDLQALTERRRGFWISLGFGLGLAATGIITFRLIRQRQLERQAELLAELGYQDSYIELYSPPAQSASPTPIAARKPLTATAPADAAFLGLVSNRHYYPIETPLDKLALPDDRPVDVIYFSSEEEARAQGFTVAR